MPPAIVRSSRVCDIGGERRFYRACDKAEKEADRGGRLFMVPAILARQPGQRVSYQEEKRKLDSGKIEAEMGADETRCSAPLRLCLCTKCSSCPIQEALSRWFSLVR